MTQIPAKPLVTYNPERFTDLNMPLGQTRADELAKTEGSGAYLGAVGDALYSESLVTGFLHAIQRGAMKPDAEWGGLGEFTTEQFDEITQDIPTEYIPELGKARSRDEFFVIAGQLKNLAQTREHLGTMGLTGAALRIGAAVLDPFAIAVGVGTGGLGLGSQAAGALTRAGRIQRITRAGLTAGIADSAAEIPRAVTDPEGSSLDIAFAFAASGVIAGGLTGLGDAYRKGVKRIEVQDLAEESRRAVAMGAASPYDPGFRPPTMKEQLLNTMTDDGRAHYAEVLSEDGRREHLRQIVDMFGDMDPEMADDIVANWDYDEAMDALRDYSKSEGHLDYDIDTFTTADISDKPNGLIDKVRFSIGGSAGKMANKNPLLAFAMRTMSQDVLSVGGESGSVWKHRQLNKLQMRITQPVEQLRSKYNQSNGVGETLNRTEWNERIAQVKREGQGGRGHDPEIQQAVKLYDEEFNRLRGMAEKHGVKGFDQFGDNPAYVPRRFSHAKFNQIVEGFDRTHVSEALFLSLKRGRIAEVIAEEGLGEADAIARRAELLAADVIDEVTDDDLRKLADGYLDGVERRRLNPVQESAFFSGDQAEALREILDDEYSELIDEAAKADIVQRVVQPGKDQGKIGSARRRVRFDETSVYDGGPDGPTIRFDDLFENDIEGLTRGYASSVLGEMVVAQTRKAVAHKIDTSGTLQINSYKQMVQEMQKHAKLRGFKMDKGDFDTLEFLDRYTRDKLQPPKTELGRKAVAASRILRFGNLIRIGGSFGMAQIPEYFGMVAQSGIRASIQQMPSFKGFMEFARTGLLRNEFSRDMQEWLGAGADPWSHALSAQQDGFLTNSITSGGMWEKLAKRGVDITNLIAGTRYIDSYSRVAAAKVGMQNLINKAASGRIKDSDLALLGLNRAQWDKVSKAVRGEIDAGRGIVTEKGLADLKAKRFFPEDFEDRQAAAMLIQAVDRWSGTSIQRNDIGQLHAFMSTEAGKVLFQFQTFHLASWDKQFLLLLHNPASPQLISKALIGGITASGVYTLQQYARSRSDDDPQAYRDKHLSLAAIVKAGAQRGGTASLMPQFIDSVASHTGFDPVFNARNSGLESLQNPTSQFFTDAKGSVRSLAQAATGQDDFSETDARRVARLMPFRTAPVLKQISDSLVEGFDDEQR